MNFMTNPRLNERADYNQIVKLIEPDSRVLDVGCGSGELLKQLIKEKNVQGRGVEIDENGIVSCIDKGISVIQADVDEGLADFLDLTFDYVILSKTLQVVHQPDYVIREMLRVGKKGIVSLPNFGFWPLRFQMITKGKMPKGKHVPFEWYNTPNIHIGTLSDFRDLCQKEKISIVKEISFRSSKLLSGSWQGWFSNILADESIFVIAKQADA